MRDAILVVRPTVQIEAAPALIDAETGIPTGDPAVFVTAPQTPLGWDYQIEAGGWITYWPRGRTARPNVFLHVLPVATGLTSGRACFLVQGPSAILDNIASSSFRSWNGAMAMRADTLATAVSVRSKWYDPDRRGIVSSRVAGYLDTSAESRNNEGEEG